jgi:hypothetical protein
LLKLRNHPTRISSIRPLLDEAAEEIERLRGALEGERKLRDELAAALDQRTRLPHEQVLAACRPPTYCHRAGQARDMEEWAERYTPKGLCVRNNSFQQDIVRQT